MIFFKGIIGFTKISGMDGSDTELLLGGRNPVSVGFLFVEEFKAGRRPDRADSRVKGVPWEETYGRNPVWEESQWTPLFYLTLWW